MLQIGIIDKSSACSMGSTYVPTTVSHEVILWGTILHDLVQCLQYSFEIGINSKSEL